MPSYKAEVIADSSGNWCSNALRFRTAEAAERYAADLAGRWTMVREYRATACDDPPTDDDTVKLWEAIVSRNPRSVKL